MKKFFSLMLVALVMLGVTACEQNVTIDTPKSEGLSFYAEIAMTRANLEQGTDDGKWTTVWEGNETLYVNEFAFTNTESEPSKFTCTTEGVADLVGQDVTIKMDNNSVPESGKGIMIEQSITAFDPTSTINLTAKNAFFRFTYTGDVTFTLSQPLFVVDGAEVDTITVTADGDTWVSVLPGTADLSFVGSTNGETKTKENFNIVAGKIYNLGTLTDNTVYVYKPITSLVDLTDGEYIIVATVDDKSYAMSDTLSSGKINGSEIQLTDGIVSLENAEGFVWNIAEITDGNFSISNGTKYLSWSSSTSFGLVDDVYSWIPSSENEGWKFVAGTTTNLSTVRCILFQTQNGNNRFAPYAVSNFTSTDYKPIKLYKKMAENEEPYKTPIITADITSKSVGVEGEKFEISVTATNFDVKDIVVEKDVEWFTATHNGEGKIAVSVAENATTSVREGYITISYPGATSVVVTLSQAANAVKVTIAEFLAAAEDDTLYELSGTIISVVNTTYGNFTIMDDTGEVYIYGLYSPEGAEKYWSESNAKLGDDITIKTVRTSHNGIAQGANAIFVELVSPGTRAFWTFDKTDVNFASNGGSEEVNVEIYNLDEQVTVASDNAQFTASYTDGVLTITAAENTVSEVIEGKITVTCGTLSQTITVSLAAKSTGEEADAWTLVTDASTLAVDDQVVLVASNADYALSTNQKTNNRGAVAISKSGNTILIDDDVQILTLEAGTVDGTFAFYTGSGYLYAASSSYNHLKTQTTNNGNSSWKITITDGKASIVAQGTNTRNVMQYNPNNGSPLFACYSSASQTAIAIYKLAK
ncbi:MAG: BACON domain-containing protein [Alistipes sp.]|nr:BACON domain-containing protein [Alistipes sp.]